MPFADGLTPKKALPVSLRHVPASSFEMLGQTQTADNSSSYSYIVDFGKNFQGHLNLSFSSGQPGQEVTVQLGEQRLANGSVKYHMESNNVYSYRWTLSGGLETVVPHEYCEFRWAEISGAPEPPSHDRVSGWIVHYPFDGDLNEGPALTQRVPMSTPTNPLGLTVFSSAVEPLNQVGVPDV